MQKLIAEGVKVDMVLTDPPYGTTACKWDNIIPFDEMWGCIYELIKDNGAIALFGSEPFSSMLRCSNLKMFKYDWLWEKDQAANFQLAKKQPLKTHEILSVFYKVQPCYNPQDLIISGKIKSNLNKSGRLGHLSSESKRSMYTQEFSNYPKSILRYARDRGLHPTQKPVGLLEYIIKTYTHEGDTVLDFTMGSGSTGVACLNTNRNFIGIELDENYFSIAIDRVDPL